MQVKVIKAINGLEEGDILNYNEKTHKYEIKKVEEDISDRGYSSKKTMHTYSKNTILDNPEYFEIISEDGDKIEVKSVIEETSKSEEVIDKPDYRNKVIDNLNNKIEELVKENKELRFQYTNKWMDYNEWKFLHNWYKEKIRYGM
jgi:hypothetical protein